MLTQLVERKYEDGNPYFIGWIVSHRVPNKISFHQKSLITRKEVNDLQEGIFVFFEVKITQTPQGNRQDAINCSLIYEKTILEDIIQYDLETIKFIFRYAIDELKTKLVIKIGTAQQKASDKNILEYITEIKKVLPNIFQISEEQKKLSTEYQNEPIQTNKILKSFFGGIFQSNNLEYNQNLLNILAEGLKIIDNENIFQQAKFLLELNKTVTKGKTENLSSIFYNKATNDYKFRLWFEGLTDYCSTEILKYHFDKATLDFKNQIIQRCQGNENGFLVLDNQVKKPNEIEEVYFSDIRTKLLQELNKAKRIIQVAVAWFTNDDLFNMLCMKLEQGVKVELIIINDYINNWEFGLPFQTFVNLKGRLYLSEYPSIMHHKFCLIDNETIFNGSYNWTYYAESRNDENIMLFKGKSNLMKEFKAEFKRLKSKLGDPITTVIPFDNSQVMKFEKIAFREYFSIDLILRAETIYKTNIICASELLNTAIELDIENTGAQTFQKEIQPEVQLQQRTIQIQNIITEENQLISDESTDAQQVDRVLDDIKPIRKITRQAFKQRITQMFSKQPIQNNTKTTNNVKTTPIQIQKTNTIIVENYSVPIQPSSTQQFQKLKIAIALDISGSMDNLYKNGTVQQVVEKLLAVALSISANEQLDIWTFNNNARRLISVSKSNFQNYVNNNSITSSGGTNASAVLNDIYKKYFQETTGYNVFAIILTDGDIGELQSIITNSNSKPVFWQFVGLGSDFTKLQVVNKNNKNVAFFSLNNIATILDEDLYKRLLAEFPVWYKESELNGIIK